MTTFEIAPMTDADTPAVLVLLEQSGLLTSGVRENTAGFLVLRSNGKLVGSAGVETYTKLGLLRGVAVDRAARRQGIGTALVQRILSRAAVDRLSALYLLTTSAARYFERFGFEVSSRDDAPDGIRESWEFRSGCPATATLMRRRIW
jgi:amino-acid N-acetyltransferase